MAGGRVRLGFFTRVLEDATAADRYRFAVDQIAAAEQAGFDTAWVAQHHFRRAEGGLPSPFVLLSYAAAMTERITLGTAIVTLGLEDPVRVAEDAAVLARLSGGRFELGVGSGRADSAFGPFGKDPTARRALYADHLRRLDAALAGDVLTDDHAGLYPQAPELRRSLWEATFTTAGAARIGAAGHGLMLARHQPHTAEQPTLAAVQKPLVDAYRAALPADAAPRILVSRTVFVTRDRITARALAERGRERAGALAVAAGERVPGGADLAAVLRDLDVHVGPPDRIAEELSDDEVLGEATDVVFQVHPVDPAHELALTSIRLLAGDVAPALGWTPARHTGNRPARAMARGWGQ